MWLIRSKYTNGAFQTCNQQYLTDDVLLPSAENEERSEEMQATAAHLVFSEDTEFILASKNDSKENYLLAYYRY